MSRWLKLQVAWSTSSWLCTLSEGSRLAWIELLCYIKTCGFDGKAKAPSTAAFARRNFISEGAVTDMLLAAETDGALQILDGEWIVTNWSKYQGDETGRERQSRFKERQKSNDNNALPTFEDVTHGKKEKEKEKETNPPASPKGGRRQDHSIGIEIPRDLCDIAGFSDAWKSRCSQRFAKANTRFPTIESVEAELRQLQGCHNPVEVVERAVAAGWQGLNIRESDKREAFSPLQPPVQSDEVGRFLN